MQQVLDKQSNKEIEQNPLLAVPKSFIEQNSAGDTAAAQKSSVAHLTQTFVNQAEPPSETSQVVNLSDVDQLNQEQRELLYAVEKNDGRQLVVLGGANSADVNFHIGRDGMFLLLIAAAKNHNEIINLML